MNRITKITVSNLKDLSFGIDLETMNLVVGENSRGKTAILDAIRVALLGYHPNLGKRNLDTFQLCSGDTLSVRANFSTGDSIVRKWTNHAGSIRYEGPSDPIVPAVLLDAREYLGMSAKQKVKYVFDRVDVAKLGMNDDTLLERVAGIETPDLTAVAELKEQIKDIKISMSDRDQSGETLQEWSERLIARLQIEKRDSVSSMKSMTGMVAAQTQLAAPVGRSVSEIEKALKELVEKRQSLLLDRQRREDAQQSARQRKGERERMERELKRTVNDLEDRIVELKEQCNAESAQMLRLFKRDDCPTCHSKGKAWKAAFKKTVDAANKQREDTMVELKKELKQQNDKLQKFQQESERLKEEAEAPQNTSNDLALLNSRISELEREQRSAISDHSEQLRRMEAQQRYSELESKCKVKTDVLDELQGYMREMVDKVLHVVIERTRQFTEGLLAGNLEYRNGDIGYARGKSWVTHSTFSGTEELIAFAALSVALAQESNIKIVLMDELGRLHPKLKQPLLDRMESLIKQNVISQFVGVDALSDPSEHYTSRTCKVIQIK